MEWTCRRCLQLLATATCSAQNGCEKICRKRDLHNRSNWSARRHTLDIHSNCGEHPTRRWEINFILQFEFENVKGWNWTGKRKGQRNDANSSFALQMRTSQWASRTYDDSILLPFGRFEFIKGAADMRRCECETESKKKKRRLRATIVINMKKNYLTHWNVSFLFSFSSIFIIIGSVARASLL